MKRSSAQSIRRLARPDAVKEENEGLIKNEDHDVVDFIRAAGMAHNQRAFAAMWADSSA
jgi:hypothetical protein